MKMPKFKIYLMILALVATLAVAISPTPVLASSDSNTKEYAILNPPSNQNGISYLLNLAIKILTGLVAVAAVTSIILAGVQYASAGDSPEKVKAAKDRIAQTVIGILLYIFMFAILEFIIPGGVLGIRSGDNSNPTDPESTPTAPGNPTTGAPTTKDD